MTPERAGTLAVDALNSEWAAGGCVDQSAPKFPSTPIFFPILSASFHRNMQDQIIIFMALAHGRSRVRTGPITLHTQTAIHFTRLLTGVCFIYALLN